MQPNTKSLQNDLLAIYHLFYVLPQILQLIGKSDEKCHLILQKLMTDMVELQQLLVHFELFLGKAEDLGR